MINMKELSTSYSRLFTNDCDCNSPRILRDLIALTSYFIDSNTPQKILDDLNVLRKAILKLQIKQADLNRQLESVKSDYRNDFRCRVEGVSEGTPFTFAPTITLPEFVPQLNSDQYISEFMETINEVDFSSIIIYLKQRKKETLVDD